MLQLKWGRSLSVWKERKEAGWMYCKSTHNRRPAGARQFCGVLALWHCLEEACNRNPPAVAILPTVFLVLQTLGIVHVASTQLLENHPVLIKWETFWPETLHFQTFAFPNCKEEKKSRCLPLPLSHVSTYLFPKYRRGLGFFLAAPPKNEGQGLNLCIVNKWLDFWKMLSFILLLRACQLDSWVFLCALSVRSGPSDKAVYWASPVFSPCGSWTHLRMISQLPWIVSVDKNPSANARDTSSIPGLWRSHMPCSN